VNLFFQGIRGASLVTYQDRLLKEIPGLHEEGDDGGKMKILFGTYSGFLMQVLDAQLAGICCAQFVNWPEFFRQFVNPYLRTN
jgi:hypothetical protein